MSGPHTVTLGIAALALLCYLLRASGFLIAARIDPDGVPARLLERAPGNLFVAFIVAGVASGGWPIFAGAVAGLAAAMVLRHEIAALGFGAAGVALASWLLG